ncbi:efflux RND transporter periplasmic adaptor subunit [Magnetococcus sp. PR-3]|uniref:efflux RND transporter periplasmic adaptor subunit n=1 Tax=Magnetococcus sp. PR-3 TaxID=3120355 RepID=UPI002FCE2304
MINIRGLKRIPLSGLMLLLWVIPAVHADEKVESPVSKAAAQSSQVVTVKPVRDLLVKPREEAPATVVGLRDVWVTAQVSAPILELHAETGDRVAWGAVLSRQDTWAQGLEHKRALGALNVLKSQLPLADQQLERVEKLIKKGQSTEEILDRRRSEKRTLKARIQEAKVAVEHTAKYMEKGVVKAPFSGVVVARRAQIGAWAEPGTPLFQLVDPVRVMLEARISPERLKSTKMATSWIFEHAGGRAVVKLSTVLPIQDEASRSVRARFRFGGIKPPPGTAGRLIWTDNRGWVEPGLLVRRDTKLGLFIVDDDQVAHFIPLPHAREGRRARLPALFTPDMPVVVKGRHNVQEGDKVKVEVE